MKRIYDRKEVATKFRKEYNSEAMAAKISSDIMNRVKNHRYDWDSCGSWFENVPRKAVDILVEHGWYVRKDPGIPDKYVVMFRNANIGQPLDYEDEIEYLDDEEYEEIEYEES